MVRTKLMNSTAQTTNEDLEKSGSGDLVDESSSDKTVASGEASLDQRFDELKEINEKISVEIRQLREENEHLQNEILTIREEKLKLQSRVQLIEDDNRILTTKLEEEAHFWKMEMEKSFRKHKREQEQLKSYIKERNQLGKLTEELQVELQNAYNEIKKKQEELDAVEKARNREQELLWLQEVESLRSAKVNLIVENAKLEDQYKVVLEELQCLKDKLVHEHLQLKTEAMKHVLLKAEFNSLLEENNNLKLQCQNNLKTYPQQCKKLDENSMSRLISIQNVIKAMPTATKSNTNIKLVRDREYTVNFGKKKTRLSTETKRLSKRANFEVPCMLYS